MEQRDPIPTFIAIQQELPAARMRRQRERALRILMWIAAAFAAVVIVLGIVLVRFDPNAHRAEIEAAVSAATGREFHVRGRLAVTSYRHMTIAASNVELGNAAWGSQPAMLQLGRVEADFALFPLLHRRFEIPRLIVEDSDVLLEIDKDGRANWQFTPQPQQAAPRPSGRPPPGAPAARTPDATAPALIVHALHLRDAHVTWRDARSGQRGEITLRRITTSENPRDATISVGAELVVGSQPITFNGQTSSLARLLDPNAEGPPWGGILTAEIPGMKLTVAGTLERPLEAAGYKLRLDGVASDVSGLSNLLATPLPPLHNLTLAAEVNEVGGRPEVSNLALQIGSSDLRGLARGVKIEQAVFDAKLPTDPIRVEARGTASGNELRIAGRLGTPAELVRGDVGIGVDLLASMGESTLAVAGTLPAWRGGAGLDVAVRLDAKDLADFAAMTLLKLPPMRPARFAGRIATTPSGLALRDATIQLPPADVIVDVDYATAPRRALRLFLRGPRLDADAMIKAFGDLSLTPPSNEMPLGALPIPRSIRPVIPDDKLRLGWLSAMDIDAHVDLQSLTLSGMTATAVAGQLQVLDRHLTVDKLTGALPGGPFDLTLDLNAADPALPYALTLHAPSLDLHAMLQSMGRTEDVSGLMEIDADLRGAGVSPHDMAGTVTGHLGASMVDGQIDNVLLDSVLGGVRRAVRVPADMLFPPGRSRLRCFALRMEARDGHASVPAFTLDAGPALIRAEGTLELGEETLNLRLRPNLRVIGQSGVTIPLKLVGRFRSPRIELDTPETSGDAARTLLGTPERLAGAVLPDGDPCVSALAIARGGRPTLTPSTAPPPPLLPFRLPLPRIPSR